MDTENEAALSPAVELRVCWSWAWTVFDQRQFAMAWGSLWTNAPAHQLLILSTFIPVLSLSPESVSLLSPNHPHLFPACQGAVLQQLLMPGPEGHFCLSRCLCPTVHSVLRRISLLHLRVHCWQTGTRLTESIWSGFLWFSKCKVTDGKNQQNLLVLALV